MQIYRMISKVLIRDVYSILRGGADYEHWEHWWPRQTVFSVIHKDEQKYIHKGLLFLLGTTLIFTIKLKWDYKKQKNLYIASLEERIKTHIHDLNKSIEKHISIIKNFEKNEIKGSEFIYKNFYSEFKNIKRFSKGEGNFLCNSEKIVLRDKRELLVSGKGISFFKTNLYEKCIDLWEYLGELLQNCMNFFFLGMGLVFLLVIFYSLLLLFLDMFIEHPDRK